MTLVACRPIIKCGKSGCAGSCPLSVVEYGFSAGKKPATCRTCGKTFPRPNVTLSDFLPAKCERKKENRSRNSSPGMSRRSRNVSPAVSRASIQKRTVKMQSWKTAPKLIRPRSTRRSRQTTKLWKNPTNMPEEHRMLITVTVSSRKWNRWMMKKLPYWRPKGNSFPCKVGSTNRKTIWSEFREKSNQNRRSVWKFCKNGLRPIRNWKQLTLNRCKPNKRWRCWEFVKRHHRKESIGEEMQTGR